MATEANSIDDITGRAKDLLHSLTIPPGIDGVDCRLGEDEAGETALFVRLHLTPSTKPDIKVLTDFTERLQIHLMANGIAYFPYVFLEAA